MKSAAVRAVAFELRDVVQTIRSEISHGDVGEVVVSGMLAEQLARELGRDAEPGAVVADDRVRLPPAAVLVRVIAGKPRPEDDELVRDADSLGIPIVLVQLWPQAEWTGPFVLSPHVVECRAGEGFPIREIADRIAESTEHAPALGARVPALRDAVADRIMKETTVRAALVGAAGSFTGASRPLIALEQVRMLSRLVSHRRGRSGPEVVAGIAATALAAGLGLRELARLTRRSLPAPVVNSAVAAGATWALGTAARRLT